MMVVVESRKLQCWHCKQLGHFSRSCPQKTANATVTTSAVPTTATASSVSSTSITTTDTTPKTNISVISTETGNHPKDREEEGWTQETWGKKKFPSKSQKSFPAKTGKNKNIEEGKKTQKIQKRKKKSRKFEYKNQEKKKGKNKWDKCTTWRNGDLNKSKEEEGQQRFYYRRRKGKKNSTKTKTCQQKQFCNKNNNDQPKLFLPHNNQRIPQHTLLNSHSPQHHLHYHPFQPQSYSPDHIRQWETQHHNHRTLSNELSWPLRRSDKLSTVSTSVKTPWNP